MTLHLSDVGPLGQEENPVVSSGKIHVLGLEAIKARLGDKWGRMGALVHQYFEAAIRREMVPGDTFFHNSELSYLVLFRGATIEETQLKCAAIAREVCQRLFGEEDKDIAVRSLTLPVDDVDLEQSDKRQSLDRQLERYGREALYKVGKPVKVAQAPAVRVKLNRNSDDYFSLPRDRPSFVFRPIWDSVRGVVLSYLCQPLPTTARSGTVFEDFCVVPDNEGEQARLDDQILKECLRRARSLRSQGLRIRFAVPVHFSTIARSRYWRTYSAVRSGSSKELLSDLAFFVHGIGASVPNIRLVDELPKLSVLSKHVFCVAEDPAGAARQFRNTGVYSLGLCFRPGMTDKEWRDRLTGLCRAGRDLRCEIFGLGNSRRASVTNAIAGGARFVEGAGIRRPVASPAHGYVYKVDDLYRIPLPPVDAIEI